MGAEKTRHRVEIGLTSRETDLDQGLNAYLLHFCICAWRRKEVQCWRVVTKVRAGLDRRMMLEDFGLEAKAACLG